MSGTCSSLTSHHWFWWCSTNELGCCFSCLIEEWFWVLTFHRFVICSSHSLLDLCDKSFISVGFFSLTICGIFDLYVVSPKITVICIVYKYHFWADDVWDWWEMCQLFSSSFSSVIEDAFCFQRELLSQFSCSTGFGVSKIGMPFTTWLGQGEMLCRNGTIS